MTSPPDHLDHRNVYVISDAPQSGRSLVFASLEAAQEFAADHTPPEQLALAPNAHLQWVHAVHEAEFDLWQARTQLPGGTGSWLIFREQVRVTAA